jgi:hypothetical protein
MSESGVKGDQGKPPVFRAMFVQFPRAMEAVSTVSDFGSVKYSWDNWRRVPDGINRYSDAMVRHLIAEGKGEVLDSDTGLPHAFSTAWNSLARLELMLIKMDQDERLYFGE